MNLFTSGVYESAECGVRSAECGVRKVEGGRWKVEGRKFITFWLSAVGFLLECVGNRFSVRHAHVCSQLQPHSLTRPLS